MSRFFRFVLAVLCLGLFVPAAATAQQSEPAVFTFVAEWAVPRAQWDEFIANWEKNTKPVLERNTANGTLLSWGVSATVVHTPDYPTHSVWWQGTSNAAIERVREELIKQPPSPAIVAATRHRDLLLRSIAHKAKAVAPSSGYLYVSTYLVKPGEGQKWRELWDKYNKPLMDDQLAKGNISYYVIQVEDVHTENPNTRWVVSIYPNAEAMDRLDAAFDAVDQKRSAEERRAIGAAFAEVLAPGTHRDFFARVLSWWHK